MEDNKGYVITKQQQRFANGKRMDECVSSDMEVGQRVFLRCSMFRGYIKAEMSPSSEASEKINPVQPWR